MQQPNYTDNQFVNGALLNQGQSYIAASLKDLGASLFTAGLFYPNDLTYTLNSLSVSVSAGTSFRLLDGEGNLCGFYGTTNGQTSSSVTVDFSSLVPASGSVTAYLVATRYALSQNSTAVIGPPIGHPDYNPSNAPFLWYTETEDSLHVYATTTAPDNATVFELLRTTLTAGQTSITSYSTANARYAQPNQSVIVYAGNPNGNLAGVQGGNGVTPSIVWDTSDNLFWVCTTTGSDSTAVWIDAAGYLQIEAVIKGAGLTPDRTNTAQLLAAINDLRTAAFPSSLASNGYKKYPDPNSPSGYFIEQWGAWVTYSGAPQQNTITFPITFPNNALNAVATLIDSTTNIGGLALYGLISSGVNFAQSYTGGQSATYSVTWRAIGY